MYAHHDRFWRSTRTGHPSSPSTMTKPFPEMGSYVARQEQGFKKKSGMKTFSTRLGEDFLSVFSTSLSALSRRFCYVLQSLNQDRRTADFQDSEGGVVPHPLGGGVATNSESKNLTFCAGNRTNPPGVLTCPHPPGGGVEAAAGLGLTYPIFPWVTKSPKKNSGTGARNWP